MQHKLQPECQGGIQSSKSQPMSQHGHRRIEELFIVESRYILSKLRLLSVPCWGISPSQGVKLDFSAQECAATLICPNFCAG